MSKFHSHFSGPFAEHLLGYISVGKGFWKAYRISWFERSFFPAQGGWQSYAWLHKLMTSHAVQGMWICTRTVYVHFQGNGLKHHVGSKLLDFILCLFLLVSSCYMVRNIFAFKILFKNVFILSITTWKVSSAFLPCGINKRSKLLGLR